MPKKSGKHSKVATGLQFKFDGTSSLDLLKLALAASVKDIDANASKSVLAEKNVRTGYTKHLVKNCELLAHSFQQSDAIAKAGLDAIHNVCVLTSHEGESVPLQTAMAQVPSLISSNGGFSVGVVTGNAASSGAGPLRVPYKGRFLEGHTLLSQLKEWHSRGIIEQDACNSIGPLAELAALDLTGHHFVCIGACSEMGPATKLLELGATVYAIDVPRQEAWRRLLQAAAASRGTLVVPLKTGSSTPVSDVKLSLGTDLNEDEFSKAAGCDILSQTPEVTAWILSQTEGNRFCLGSYVYLDGANFVRVVVAADAIMQSICALRPDTALSCLSSPTECYAVPAEAFREAERRQTSPPAGKVHRLWYASLRTASGGRYCEPAAPACVVNTSEGPVYLRDSYVWMQGPNYAFAKQIQRWRMLVARSRGHTTSANLGPMTLTRSILSNALIGAGVKGATHFGLEPFYSETSSALLCALLIHDLTCEHSAANPEKTLASPLLLFSENALHVGSWRAAFKTNSYTEVCALTYAGGKAQPYVMAGSAVAISAAMLRSRL